MKDTKSMKGDMYCTCAGGYCHRCKSWKLLILGLIVLANTMWMFINWGYLAGILLVVGAIAKMFMPHCPHYK